MTTITSALPVFIGRLEPDGLHGDLTREGGKLVWEYDDERLEAWPSPTGDNPAAWTVKWDGRESTADSADQAALWMAVEASESLSRKW